MKDFDKWNVLKQKLDRKNIFDTDKKVKVVAKSKDLWWCHVGLNVGSEEFGKHEEFERPVVILAKLSATTYLVAPTTSKFKEHKFRVKVRTADEKFSFVLVDQIKVIDVRRLKRKIGVVVDEDFLNLNQVMWKEIFHKNCETPLSRDFSEPLGTVNSSITNEKNKSSNDII